MKDESMIETFKENITYLTKRGFKPVFNIIDHVAYKEIKQYRRGEHKNTTGRTAQPLCEGSRTCDTNVQKPHNCRPHHMWWKMSLFTVVQTNNSGTRQIKYAQDLTHTSKTIRIPRFRRPPQFKQIPLCPARMSPNNIQCTIKTHDMGTKSLLRCLASKRHWWLITC